MSSPHPRLPMRLRIYPAHLIGLAFGLLLGTWCIHTGFETAHHSHSPSPVISAKP